jgi:hypothetical protein
MRARALLLGLSTLSWGAGALALILGGCLIEERPFDEQLGRCETYCEEVEEKCAGQYQVYESRDTCRAVCARMEPGVNLTGNTNTLSCRMEILGRADFEAPSLCSQVGPGGHGACGTDCEALCKLRAQVCSTVQPGDVAITNPDRCETHCAALRSNDTLEVDRDQSGDTLQCRLVHISKAAIGAEQAEEHCAYSQVDAPPGENVKLGLEGKAPCSDPPNIDQAVECETYCGLVTGVCTGDVAVYQNVAECLAVCGLLPQGVPGDQAENTSRCRRYHSYAAMSNTTTHCTHAGPTGDGHCGTDNCTTYCEMVGEACSTSYMAAFGSLEIQPCLDACAGLEGAGRDEFVRTRYTVSTPPTGPSLRCRTFYAVEAMSVPNNDVQCAAALGGQAPCE